MQIVPSVNQFKMFHWIAFGNEPKKDTIFDYTLQLINIIFRKFFKVGSWFVYFLALVFLIVGVAYFFIDETRKRNLLERRREVRRARERPPQRRRPGAIARNHEIYRTVMGKIKEYIEPNINQTCVFRQTRSGTIYGHVVDPTVKNSNQEETETKEVGEPKTDTENLDAQNVVICL